MEYATSPDGIVKADATFLPVSHKGNHKQERKFQKDNRTILNRMVWLARNGAP